MHVTVAEHGRSVTFMVAGNTADEPWSFGEVDVRLAEDLLADLELAVVSLAALPRRGEPVVRVLVALLGDR